jgi:hypothetical protein
MNMRFPKLGTLSTCVGAVVLVAMGRLGLAQVTTYGALSNFDVPNETDDDCDEFEIELHGPHPEDVYHTYRNGNYGSPRIEAIAGGTRVTYARPQRATLPGSIEHFGISLRNFNADPAPSYMWKVCGQPAGTNQHPLQPQIVTGPGWNTEGDPVLVETVTNNDAYNRRMWVKRSVSNVVGQVTLEQLMPNDPIVTESIDVDSTPVLLFPGQSVTHHELEVGDGIVSAVLNYKVYRDRLLNGGHVVGPYAGMVMNAVSLSASACDLGAPRFLEHPQPATLPVYGEVELTVTADSDYDNGPLSFRWMHEGVEIPGADGDALTLSDITPADGGAYWCEVSNDCGLIISNAAHVTVIPCPADYNMDAFVDFFDYDEFVRDFQDGSPRSDFNGDYFLDFFDYDDFVNAFETGC